MGGIVYVTYEEGLWSKPEETAKLYEKLYVNVAPYVKQNVPKEVTEKVILNLFDIFFVLIHEKLS